MHDNDVLNSTKGIVFSVRRVSVSLTERILLHLLRIVEVVNITEELTNGGMFSRRPNEPTNILNRGKSCQVISGPCTSEIELKCNMSQLNCGVCKSCLYLSCMQGTNNL
jgi:hypothetical protein